MTDDSSAGPPRLVSSTRKLTSGSDRSSSTITMSMERDTSPGLNLMVPCRRGGGGRGRHARGAGHRGHARGTGRCGGRAEPLDAGVGPNP